MRVIGTPYASLQLFARIGDQSQLRPTSTTAQVKNALPDQRQGDRRRGGDGQLLRAMDGPLAASSLDADRRSAAAADQPRGHHPRYWEAVQTMIRTCGSSELTTGKRMERAWRDFTMVYSHGFSLVHDMSARNLALHMIGDE